MSLLSAEVNRGKTFQIVLKDIDDATIVPSSSDKIRAIIGRGGRLSLDLSDAQLAITSGTDTANGSSFSKNTPSSGTNRLRLDASDLNFAPGVYTVFIDYLESADSSEWKNVDRLILSLEETE